MNKMTRRLGAAIAIVAIPIIAWLGYQYYLINNYSSDGLWRGTFDINGRGPFNLTVLYVDGKLVGISPDARVLYRGVVEVEGTDYHSSMDMFYMNANPFAKVNLVGHMPSAHEIKAQFKTVEAGDEGQLSMHMDEKNYHQSSAIKKVQGRWVLYRGTEITQLNIDSHGNIRGGNTLACEYNGRIDIIDKRYNAYQIKLMLSSCNDRDGYLEGFAYLDSSVTINDTLNAYIFNDNWGSYLPVVRNDDTRTIDQRKL